MKPLIHTLQHKLSGATLSGHITSNSGTSIDTKEFRCHVKGAAKTADRDSWGFRTEVDFELTTFDLRLTSEVKWIGSMPMIHIDDVQLPEGRTLSAHVIIDFHHDLFAGTWCLGEAAGCVFGTIAEAETPSHPRRYVIERSSECLREWWTGTDWSDDYTTAKWYENKPDAGHESEDEEARPCYYPSGQVEAG